MKVISSLLVCGVIISLFGSCVKMHEPAPVEQPGVPVRVSMHVKLPSFSSPQSEAKTARATANGNSEFKVQLTIEDKQELQTRSSGTTSLYNLWVLQFATDKTARKISKISNVPAPIKDMVTIDAELLTGKNQTIYLVSLGKQYESVDLSSIQNISELENFALPFVRYEDGIAMPIIQTDEDVPYQGSQAGLNIIQIEKDGRGLIEYDPSLNFSGAIPIRAMVSKISVDLTYTVGGLTPYILMLNNIPSSFAINNSSYKASDFVAMPATELNPSAFAGGKRYVNSWYLAPNPQGVVSTITSEPSRYFYYDTQGIATGDAPRNGTYLNFWAKDNTKADTYAQYYMFLGSNNTNDFNIYANNNYKLRSDINSVEYLTDKRIRYGTLIQNVDFSAYSYAPGNVKTYPKIRISGNHRFDAHPDMRPIEVSALRGIVKVEVLKTPTDTDPIAVEDSWLKLSSYPNYTEAFKQNEVGDREGLVTTITKKADIPGVFKFYLYSDEYMEYVSKTVDASSKDRSLYIRFTFNTGTTSDITDVTTVQMLQKAGYYLGLFGGEFNENTGEYSKGLIFESMEELNTSVKYLSYYAYNQGTVFRGAYNGTFDVLFDSSKYDVGNLYSGKKATLYAAINKGNLKLNYYTTSSQFIFEEPKYIGGKLDLYQYSIQKGNYFAARYCYDKNRDTNGDGVINSDEYNWYWPAYHQSQAFVFNMFGDLNGSIQRNGLTTYFVSTSQSNATNYYAFTQTNFRYTTAFYSNGYTVRCVRDVDIPTDNSMPKGFKTYVEDEYAVIDAMGLSSSVREDRATNTSLILNDEGRVIRHIEASGTMLSAATKASRVSARFRVAPCDIDSLGSPRNSGVANSGLMTWAHASGYNTVGNSWPIDTPLGITDRGCPAYDGKNGGEKGKWRLPTESEMALIGMMDEVMGKTNAQTGYEKLVYRLSENVNYWTSTESGSTTPVKDAITWNSYYAYKAGLVTTYTKGHFVSTTKTSPHFVRCIMDLPEK